MATKEISAREYANRENKAARWAGYFRAHGFTAGMVADLGLTNPAWKELSVSISAEEVAKGSRKLNPPNHQETVDAIVRHLGYYEEQK